MVMKKHTIPSQPGPRDHGSIEESRMSRVLDLKRAIEAGSYDIDGHLAELLQRMKNGIAGAEDCGTDPHREPEGLASGINTRPQL